MVVMTSCNGDSGHYTVIVMVSDNILGKKHSDDDCDHYPTIDVMTHSKLIWW